MKKTLFVLLLLILGLSWWFYQREEGRDWQGKQAVIPLEQVVPQPLDKPQYGKGIVRFSPDSQYLAVASQGGKVRIMETKNQKLLWEKTMGIGCVKYLAFSPDSRYLFLGEESPDGNLYCFSLLQKKIVWQYSTGKDLGSNLAKKSYPVINRIVLDPQTNKVYFSAGRWEKVGEGDYSHQGRIYACQAADGQLLWKFPAQKNLPVNSKYIDLDQQGRILVFSTSGNSDDQDIEDYPPGLIGCLQADSGQELWQKRIPPYKPFFEATNFSQSPSISRDGKHIALITNDGRGFLLDRGGNILWEKEITSPSREIKGISLYAPGTFAGFAGKQVIFRTANTYDAWQKQPDLPLEHPNGNSIFAYSLAGHLLWKWQAKGYIPQMQIRDKYLLIPVEKNFRTQDLTVQGVYLLDIAQGQQKKTALLETYHSATQGGIISADLSPDGRYVAALEVPLLLADKSIVGKSQLHLWRR